MYATTRTQLGNGDGTVVSSSGSKPKAHGSVVNVVGSDHESYARLDPRGRYSKDLQP